jgi:hypothetical protein
VGRGALGGQEKLRPNPPERKLTGEGKSQKQKALRGNKKERKAKSEVETLLHFDLLILPHYFPH